MSCPRSLPKPPWPQRAGFALCPHAPFPHALCPDLCSPDAGHTQLHPPRRPHSTSVASILCTCVLQDRGPCGHSRRHALSPRCHGWGGGRRSGGRRCWGPRPHGPGSWSAAGRRLEEQVGRLRGARTVPQLRWGRRWHPVPARAQDTQAAPGR